jgi:drug/metabolite transporter (DMT)-like permease
MISNRQPDWLTLLAFAGVVLFGGGNAIAVKESVIELDPFWSAALRFAVAGLLLVGIVALTGRPLPRGRSLVGALAYGGVTFSGSFGFIYPALRDVSAGTVMIFLALVPLETFGLAIIQGQERFRLQGLLGAVIALGGVALVVVDQVRADVPVLSLLFILVGTVFIAEGTVILKGVPRSDPFSTNGAAMLTAAAVLLAMSLIAGESWVVPDQIVTWAAVGYLVLFGSIVLFGLYLFALRRWTASAISYTTLLMPIVTLPVAAVLLGESVSVSFLAGGAIAIGGVYVGALLRVRRHETATVGLPECLPTEGAAEPSRARG